jgi:hypothetical protein
LECHFASVLALVFFVSGGMKLVQPKDRLASSGLRWTEDFGTGTVKLIGALEVLAALALILPAVLSIAVVLVPLSALGFGGVDDWRGDHPPSPQGAADDRGQ